MSHYSCHNSIRAAGYWARDLIHEDPLPPQSWWKWIKDEMSQDCRYDLRTSDAKCEGCVRAR